MLFCFGAFASISFVTLLGAPFFIFLWLSYYRILGKKIEHRLTYAFLVAFFLTFVFHVFLVLASFILLPVFGCRIF